MTDVFNNTAAPIGLPSGQVIQPGASIDVSDWNEQSGHAVVKAWLKAKVISTGKPSSSGDQGDGRDETPEMAELRKRFDASYAQVAGEVERLNGELAAANATIKELRQSQTSAGAEGGQDPAKPAYAVKDKGRGWNVIVDAEGNELTKSLRDDAVAGFDAKSDEDKAAFVEANKAD